MSVFAHLEIESEVQIYDKTRINAKRCFATKDDDAINSILITPSVGITAIQVWEAGEENWHLDYAHQNASYDITAANQAFYFNEGAATLTATLTTGAYTLAQLLTELQTQLNAAGGAYTVTQASNKVTIAGSQSFEVEASEIQKALMIPLKTSSSSTTGQPIEYGIKAISVTATNGTNSDTKAFFQKVYTVAGDYLFCDDSDLTAHEPDILTFIPDGRGTFKNVYRRAQKLIVAWLDEKGYVNAYGNKFTKKDIIDIEEVRQWSTFMSLRLIYESQSNSVDDVFSDKAKKYDTLEQQARNRAILRIDVNQDGEATNLEGLDPAYGSIYRR